MLSFWNKVPYLGYSYGIAETVSSLLRHARTSHGAFRALARSRDYTAQEQHIRAELGSRHAAQFLDPQVVDPAWLEDQRLNKGQSNDVLVAFCEGWLQRP